MAEYKDRNPYFTPKHTDYRNIGNICDVIASTYTKKETSDETDGKKEVVKYLGIENTACPIPKVSAHYSPLILYIIIIIVNYISYIPM